MLIVEGVKLTKKSTSGTCHLLGCSLVCWHLKKQACVSLSTIEAEWIYCCRKLLCSNLLDETTSKRFWYPLKPLLKCDNTSAINLTKNPIMHSRTKHIEIRHHFLRDHISKGNCMIEYVDTKHLLANIFTKPLAKR